MAQRACNFSIKIILFITTMLIIAKVVPYEGFVDELANCIGDQNAAKFSSFILGEPDLEVWDSLRMYLSILLNTLVSIPVMSMIDTFYVGVKRGMSTSSLFCIWGVTSLRRYGKILTFTFIFWVLLRFIPYQYMFPDDKVYSSIILVAVAVFNLIITIVCYGLIKKIIFSKGS